MNANEKNQNILVFGGFVLISAICVLPLLIFGKTPVLRDTFFEFRFLYDYARENILNGIVPLWNPYSNCGQPFIANPQSGFFYPLNWLYYLLQFHFAYILFIFIHLLLAGVFMHAFIKPIVKDRWIGFWGGVVYMLNGLVISRVEFLSEFASLVWIPAILALLRVNILSPSVLSSVLLALAIAMQFFAGHTQSFYFTTLLGLTFLFFLGCIYYIRDKNISAVLTSLKFLIVAGILALLVVMIQLAPTYELFNHSLRSQGGYDARTALASLHPLHFLTFIYPFLFGWPGYSNYWGSTYEFWASSFYAGIIPVVLCLLAVILMTTVIKKRSGIMRLELYYAFFFLTWFGMAFVVAMGDYSPVFRIFYEYVPGFDLFRWPSSSLLFGTLSMSVLAPLGLKWLIECTGDHVAKKPRWPTVTFGALLTVFLVFAVAMNLSPSMAEKIVETLRPTPSQTLTEFRQFVENITGTSILSGRSHPRSVGSTVLFSASFMVLICVLLWKRFSGKLTDRLLIHCVIIFTAIDLIGHAAMGLNFSDKRVNLLKPAIVESADDSFRYHRVMARTDGFQQYAYGSEDPATLSLGIDALTGEVGLSHKLFRTEGKGVLKIKNFSEFSGFRRLPYPLQLKILQFLNVKHVIHFKPDSILGTEPAGREPSFSDEYQKMAALDSARWSIQTTEIEGMLPKMFVVPRFSIMPSDTIDQKNEIFKRFMAASFNFSETVILDEPLEGLAASEDIKFVIHQPASYANPNQVQAIIEADRDGILVLSDVFYPGWELFINGEKQKIYKANTTFRAGGIKAGVNKILFNYNPQSFKIGLIFTIIGIGLTILLLIIHFRTGERRNLRLFKT